MKNLVVLSGAGMSAESGISTFRDSNGLWENYNVEDVASIDGWYRNKNLMLDFYNARRHELEKAQPNEGHIYVARLQERYNVTVVTQNIDNLHERAGSKKVIHLHGELTKARGENQGYYLAHDIGYKDIKIGDKTSGGDQLRPHIVWFGEAVPELARAASEIEKADLMIIIGTSLVVYPAAGLVNYTKPDCKIYLVDPKPVSTSAHVEQIMKKASEGMKDLWEILKG